MHARLPKTYKKLIVDNLTSDFRKATKLIESPFPTKLSTNSSILVKNHYAGINASDINFTSGKYYPGKKPPFPVGFEGVGEVVMRLICAKSFPLGLPTLATLPLFTVLLLLG